MAKSKIGQLCAFVEADALCIRDPEDRLATVRHALRQHRVSATLTDEGKLRLVTTTFADEMVL